MEAATASGIGTTAFATQTAACADYALRQRPCVVPADLRPHRRGSRLAKLAVIGADTAAVAVAMVAAIAGNELLAGDSQAVGPALSVGALTLAAWPMIYARHGLYSVSVTSSAVAETKAILHASGVATALTALVGVLTAERVPRAWFVLLYGVSVTTVLIERSIVRAAFRRARRNGRMRRRTLIVGTNDEARDLEAMLRRDPSLGYEVVGLLASTTAARDRDRPSVLGHWPDAVSVVRRHGITSVVIVTDAIDSAAANWIARELNEIGCDVELTSGLVDIAPTRLRTRPLGNRPVSYLRPVRRGGWRAAAKRAFDIGFAVVLTVVTLPVLAAAVLLIKLDSRGPAFFSQPRVGLGGRVFRVYKLRTMVVGAEDLLGEMRDRNEADGPLFKIRDDPRVTRVGKFLRRWSIDELPQLWNVLVGEMSLVGPRPALPSEVASWTEELHARLRVKPGVTGLWQTSGRSDSSFDEYVRSDLYYVDNWSLLFDLAIVLKTIPTVLFARGAY